MLTPLRQRFVREYLVDLNAQEAYKRAGYKVKNDHVAAVEGGRLLINPDVAAMIAEAQAVAAESTELTQEWVLSRLREESQDRGEGSSHSARVAALKLLGLHQGMFAQRVEVNAQVVVKKIRYVVAEVTAGGGAGSLPAPSTTRLSNQ